MGIAVDRLPVEGAPQVGITVTGLDPIDESVISVQVSWDGGSSWHGVRGAEKVAATGSAFFRDFVPPLNVEATYRVVEHSGPGLLPDERYEWTGTPHASTSLELFAGGLTRTNYASNPSFETGATVTATGGAPVLASVAGDAASGTHRLRITGASPSVVSFVVPAAEMPVSAGEWAAFGVNLNRESGSSFSAAVQFQWRLGSTQVSLSDLVFMTLTTASLSNKSTKMAFARQVPAGVDNVRVIVRFTSATAPGTLTPPPEGWVSGMDAVILTKAVSESRASDAVGAWRFTASGDPFTKVTQAIAGHDQATLITPGGAARREGVPMVVYCHGAGGGPDNFATSSAWESMRSWLVANGWAAVEGTAGPDPVTAAVNWGNADARAAYLAYIAWARSEINVGPIVILGRSMGGIVASWLTTRSPIAGDIAGLIMNSAVSTMFIGDAPGTGTAASRSTPAYFSNVAAAYGVDNTQPDWYSTLQTVAADFAPEGFSPPVWDGKKILHLYGTADATVPWYPRGGSYMRTLWAGRPAVDLVDVKVGGDHAPGTGSYEQVEPMANFLSSITTVEDDGIAAVGYFDGDTQNGPTTVEDQILVESDTAWIQDPLDPRGAVPVVCERGEDAISIQAASFTSFRRGQVVDRVMVEGARLPVASVGVRQAVSEVPLHLRAYAAAQGELVRSLRALFDEAGVLVLRGLPADLPLDAVAHVTAGDIAEVPVVGGQVGMYNDWHLVVDQVRPTSMKVVVPWFTYNQVYALWQEWTAGATYDQVIATRPGDTYLDWQRDPEVP